MANEPKQKFEAGDTVTYWQGSHSQRVPIHAVIVRVKEGSFYDYDIEVIGAKVRPIRSVIAKSVTPPECSGSVYGNHEWNGDLCGWCKTPKAAVRSAEPPR